MKHVKVLCLVLLSLWAAGDPLPLLECPLQGHPPAPLPDTDTRLELEAVGSDPVHPHLIRVWWQDRELGYLPRKHSEVLHQLMKAGYRRGSSSRSRC